MLRVGAVSCFAEEMFLNLTMVYLCIQCTCLEGGGEDWSDC